MDHLSSSRSNGRSNSEAALAYLTTTKLMDYVDQCSAKPCDHERCHEREDAVQNLLLKYRIMARSSNKPFRRMPIERTDSAHFASGQRVHGSDHVEAVSESRANGGKLPSQPHLSEQSPESGLSRHSLACSVQHPAGDSNPTSSQPSHNPNRDIEIKSSSTTARAARASPNTKDTSSSRNPGLSVTRHVKTSTDPRTASNTSRTAHLADSAIAMASNSTTAHPCEHAPDSNALKKSAIMPKDSSHPEPKISPIPQERENANGRLANLQAKITQAQNGLRTLTELLPTITHPETYTKLSVDDLVTDIHDLLSTISAAELELSPLKKTKRRCMN